jgi:DNA-binding transcriptional LysR family regulator
MSWFREEGAAPSVHHACSSLPTRVRMAALGMGAALVATSAAAEEVAVHRVRVLPTRRPVPAIACELAWPEAGLSPEARVVAELVRLVVAEQGGIDMPAQMHDAATE